MKESKFEHRLTAILYHIQWPAAIILFVMALLTTADVIGRKAFLSPILGNSEIQTLMMVVIIFLGMGYCTILARHANADIIITHLPKRTRAVVDSVTWFLSAAIFALITWQATKFGWNEIQSPTRTTTLLLINEGPYIMVAAFGCMTICLGSLVNFYRSLRQIPAAQESPTSKIRADKESQ